VRHILLRWLAPTYILSAKYSRSSTTSEAPRASTRSCVSEVAASGSPRPPEISCSWRLATWTFSPAMMAGRCIFGARGSTTITLCADREGTPSRSPVQLRNDGLMPWLSVTGTPDISHTLEVFGLMSGLLTGVSRYALAPVVAPA
jgi:hypothetical protein